MMMQVTTVIVYKSEPQNDDAMAIVFLMKKVHIKSFILTRSIFLLSFFFSFFFNCKIFLLKFVREIERGRFIYGIYSVFVNS